MKNNININKYWESGSSQVSVTTRVRFLYPLHHAAVSQAVAANSWEHEVAQEVYNFASFTVPKMDTTTKPNTLNP